MMRNRSEGNRKTKKRGRNPLPAVILGVLVAACAGTGASADELNLLGLEEFEADSVLSESAMVKEDTDADTEETAETEAPGDAKVLYDIGLIEEMDPQPDVGKSEMDAEEDRVHIEGETEKNRMREEMVEFAKQFVGNPYVWGGTSLTDGADCSGFCLSVYAHFGISLPRVACDQAAAGTQIPLSEAEPGDLIFYQDGTGYVYHVALCAGDGMTVQAQNSRVGIVNTGMSGATFACKYFD